MRGNTFFPMWTDNCSSTTTSYWYKVSSSVHLSSKQAEYVGPFTNTSIQLIAHHALPEQHYYLNKGHTRFALLEIHSLHKFCSLFLTKLQTSETKKQGIAQLIFASSIFGIELIIKYASILIFTLIGGNSQPV